MPMMANMNMKRGVCVGGEGGGTCTAQFVASRGLQPLMKVLLHRVPHSIVCPCSCH
jgi:hypothetical protein